MTYWWNLGLNNFCWPISLLKCTVRFLSQPLQGKIFRRTRIKFKQIPTWKVKSVLEIQNLKTFFKDGPTPTSFHLFSSFRTEHLRSQQDSNSDCRSRRQERWPLDHHHGPRPPNLEKGQIESSLVSQVAWLSDALGFVWIKNTAYFGRVPAITGANGYKPLLSQPSRRLESTSWGSTRDQ